MKERKLLFLLLMMFVFSCIVACGNSGEQALSDNQAVSGDEVSEDEISEEHDGPIWVDEDGVAHWDPVEGAVAYYVDHVYEDLDGCPTCDQTVKTTNTYIQIKDEGYCVQVCPIFEDGSTGDYIMSEYWGEYNKRSLDERYNYDVDFFSLPTWKVVENIDMDSVKYEDDGTVYFESTGPDGQPVRFWGQYVEITEDSIIVYSAGRLLSLDSIGRIMSADIYVSEESPSDIWLGVFGGFDVTGNPHPGSMDNMIFTSCYMRDAAGFMNDEDEPGEGFLIDHQPNFAGLGDAPPTYPSEPSGGTAGVIVSEFKITYMPEDECTEFKAIILDQYNYGFCLEGEKYDKTKEGLYKPYEGYFDFTLYAIPELVGELFPRTLEEYRQTDPGEYAAFLSDVGCYTIGDLKDEDGNVLDKDTAAIKAGNTLTITMGDKSYDVELPCTELFDDATTMHDLVPYSYPEAVGDLNVLVVPIAWQDEADNATEDMYNDIRSQIGRVFDADGNVTDYSSEISGDKFSLSDYFDIASYGQLSINSFMTDWYLAPYDFSDISNQRVRRDFQQEVMDWFYDCYGDMDMSQFDKNADGYIDATIFVNIGDMSNSNGFTIMSFEGAYYADNSYGNEYAGELDRPAVNSMVTINIGLMDDMTLIHEFSHLLGLIDYYDVTHSGINAVGGYDMQSDNVGDWNLYSKYAVGWIEPEIVTDLDKGESVEITIGSFAGTGDAIIIPAAGCEMTPPFCEYIAIDLFTDTGVNVYDAADYGLSNMAGVRIYHVDARMESHVYTSTEVPSMEPCTVGTIHFGNDYKETGFYNLELIQAGGVNTFTDLDSDELYPFISKDDFFEVGDVFTLEKYSDFFYDGVLDDGKDFGYKIEVVSITGSGDNAEAVIKITRE